MRLRLAALVLGVVAGFVFGWARLTDPNTFDRMFTFRSPYVYLLMASAVAIAFVGARALRGRLRCSTARASIGSKLVRRATTSWAASSSASAGG